MGRLFRTNGVLFEMPGVLGLVSPIHVWEKAKIGAKRTHTHTNRQSCLNMSNRGSSLGPNTANSQSKLFFYPAKALFLPQLSPRWWAAFTSHSESATVYYKKAIPSGLTHSNWGKLKRMYVQLLSPFSMWFHPIPHMQRRVPNVKSNQGCQSSSVLSVGLNKTLH